MIKFIPLTKGYFAIVDAKNYDELSKLNWFAQYGRNGSHYAARKDENNKQIYMHRQITNAPKGKVCDHKDDDTLNNLEDNLRVCLSKENIRRRPLDKRNKSGYRGVILCKQTGKWRVAIVVDQKTIWLGRHANKKDAATAYDEAAKNYFGEFARLNFPE